MDAKRKVLIVEHDTDLGAIYQMVLGELGYEAILVDAKGQEDLVPHLVRQRNPDLILIDIWGTHGQDFAVLDLLRSDPSIAAIPVVAMSTDEYALDQGSASFNVRQVLLKPFDLDDLEKKVTAALGDVPLLSLAKPTEAASGQVFQDVAMALSARSRSLIFLWGQKTAVRQPYAARSFRLNDLIDHMPRIMEAIIIALHTSSYERIFELHPEIEVRVADHAKLRQVQGVALDDLMHEYQHFRSGIWCEMWATAKDLALTAEDVVAVGNVIDYVLDGILAITVRTYERKATDQVEAAR
jgi:DNA-binding response OmpR family regulator